MVSHKKSCCDQIAVFIYKQLIEYVMPFVFKHNEILDNIQAIIEDLFIILIQNMCIIFNKQCKYYKTIKWITISLNIKSTAKSYYLRAMAYDLLDYSKWNKYMKNQDIKKAYQLKPQDINIAKQYSKIINEIDIYEPENE